MVSCNEECKRGAPVVFVSIKGISEGCISLSICPQQMHEVKQVRGLLRATFV